MNELPLMNKLTQRNPTVYKDHWKCMLCNQEQEFWSHLWWYSHLLSHLDALRQVTKLGFEDLLSITIPNCLTAFASAWNALTCWSLPSTNNTDYITFDYLIQGIVPL